MKYQVCTDHSFMHDDFSDALKYHHECFSQQGVRTTSRKFTSRKTSLNAVIS